MLSTLLILLISLNLSFPLEASVRQGRMTPEVAFHPTGANQQTKSPAMAPHERPSCQPMSGGSMGRRWLGNGATTASRGQIQTADQTVSSSSPSTAQSSSGQPTSGVASSSANTRIEQPLVTSLLSNSGRFPVGASATITQPSQSSHQPQTVAPGGASPLPAATRLSQLRQLILDNQYDAYLIPTNDEHGSEWAWPSDRRLHFLSDFSGSSGVALVGLSKAVLFTDGRYSLQADRELDCSWWLSVGDSPLSQLRNFLKHELRPSSSGSTGSGSTTPNNDGLQTPSNELHQTVTPPSTLNPQPFKVAADASLLSLGVFESLAEELRQLNGELVLISQDLVDIVWAAAGPEARPLAATNPLQVHPIRFAGQQSWQLKVSRLWESMAKLDVSHFLMTQLDDIAWLLNLRSDDSPATPLFKSYLLASRPTTTGSAGQLTIWLELSRVDQQVREHLGLHLEGLFGGHAQQQRVSSTTSGRSSPLISSSTGLVSPRIELRDYRSFVADLGDRLSALSKSSQTGSRLLLEAGSNVAVHVVAARSYPDRLVLFGDGLVANLKAVRTDQEVDGQRSAHYRDSLAICMLLAKLEAHFRPGSLPDNSASLTATTQNNTEWTEVSAAKELERIRSWMDYNRGQSFETISGFGPNAAVVHYNPSRSNSEPVRLGNWSTFLLDSGGQYLDGTTDITRTVHFGQPSDEMRDRYSRVLMGAIDMMSLMFAKPDAGVRINDLIARRHLFELGLDYAHGTGHGIGLYGLVHERPYLLENFAHPPPGGDQNLAANNRSLATGNKSLLIKDPIQIQPNMFTSIEPGYYKSNEYGIRLENIVVTKRAFPVSTSTGGLSSPVEHLRFEPLSLVPFEPRLIKSQLLSNKQKAWLNGYNLLCRLKLTHQINYYLAKNRELRRAQQQSTGSGAKTPPEGYLNFMRADQNEFANLLELTHRWIFAKTELVPLDVAAPSGAQDNRKLKAPTPQQHQEQLQRLMLTYMLAPPFNEADADEAAATLGSRTAVQSSQPTNQSSKMIISACSSSLECELELVQALRAPSSSNSAASVSIHFDRQRQSTGSGWSPSELPPTLDFDDEPNSVSSGNGASGSLSDVFSFGSSSFGVGGGGGGPLSPWQSITSGWLWPAGIRVSTWCLVAICSLIVIQTLAIVFLCREKRSGGRVYRRPSHASSVVAGHCGGRTQSCSSVQLQVNHQQQQQQQQQQQVVAATASAV